MGTRAAVFRPFQSKVLVKERVANAEIVVRKLIWAYFWLLIFEGALRMWILPKFSNELLVVRDPVVLAMYFVAMRAGFFPWNKYVIVLWILGIEMLAVGLYLHPTNAFVALYGFHAAFLHLPMIFLIPRVMSKEDVLKIGKWVLIVAIPIAIIMAIQYKVGPDSFWNKGNLDQFKQIDSADGKIRPSGTFSYNLGPGFLYPLVVAFLLYQYLGEKSVKPWLTGLAAGATILAVGVSGSRTDLASCAIVVFTGLVAGLIGGSQKIGGLIKFLLVTVIMLGVISQLSVFREGTATFSDRINNASGTEGGAKGFVDRFFNFIPQSIDAVSHAKPIGAGLGVSTNAGAKLLTDSTGFLLAEGAWPAMILEMGPFLGIFYLSLRLGLSIYLFWNTSIGAKNKRALPFLLYGVTGINIFFANFGQPTELGFVALVSGLCLASMNEQVKPNLVQPSLDNELS